MSTISIKQFDTAREIEQYLTIGGVPIDLTSTTVYLNFKDLDRGTQWQRTATIVDAVNGIVKYRPIDSDVVNSGNIELEWEILYPDTTRLTVPTTTRIELIIYPAIVPA